MPLNVGETLPHLRMREKTQASSEVDLVYTHQGRVIPIEIKSGATGSLKSLHQFVDRANHPYAVRLYAGEFSAVRTPTPAGTPYLLMNMPYYLGTKLPEYIGWLVSEHQLASVFARSGNRIPSNGASSR